MPCLPLLVMGRIARISTSGPPLSLRLHLFNDSLAIGLKAFSLFTFYGLNLYISDLMSTL